MVFTLAENTAQSIPLVSDTRLPSNFNTTKSALYFLLLKFVFPKLSGWSFSQLFLPCAVFLHLLGVLSFPGTGVLWILQKRTDPCGLSKAGG